MKFKKITDGSHVFYEVNHDHAGYDRIEQV